MDTTGLEPGATTGTIGTTGLVGTGSSSSGGESGSGDGVKTATVLPGSDESDTGDPTETPDETPETGSDTPWTDDLLSFECVADCNSELNVEPLEWCRSQVWSSPLDENYCLALAIDAVLIRCAQACECDFNCEE